MNRKTVVIVGAGPCGIAAAIELKRRGMDAVLIEKRNIVDAIYQYPIHQVFFSTSEKAGGWKSSIHVNKSKTRPPGSTRVL